MKYCLPYLLVILLLFIPGLLLGQSLYFTRYTTKDGLSDKRIRNVVQDKQGYLWIGSADGLNRFDGYEYKVFQPQPGISGSLPAAEVRPLHVDDDGNIWVNSSLGLSIYNPKNRRFNKLVHNAADTNSAPPEAHWMIKDSKNRLWLGGSKGWSLVNNQGRFTHFAYPVAEKEFSTRTRALGTEAMLEDDNDQFWIVSNYGIYSFDAAIGKTERFLFEKGKPTTQAANLFTTAYFDKTNRVIWLGSWSGGLVRFDCRTRDFRQYFFAAPNMQGNRNIITDLETKGNNELWIASPDAGLGVFNTNTLQFTFTSTPSASPDQPPLRSAKYLYKDDQQNLWISTDEGLYKLTAATSLFQWTTVPVKKMFLYNQVNAIFKEDTEDRLYIGLNIGDGVWMRHKQKWQKLTAPGYNDTEGLMTTQIFKDSRGIIWIGSNKGVYHVSNHKAKLEQDPLLKNLATGDQYVMHLQEDSEGWLYIASRWNGFYRYHPEKKLIQHYSTSPASPVPLRSNRVANITEHSPGKLLITAVDIGPYLLDIDQKKTISVLPEATLQQLHSFRQTIRDAAGNYWIGTYQTGLVRLIPSTGMWKMQRYFTEQGHPGLHISKMQLQGSDDHLWFTTQKGLLHFHIPSGETRLFNEGDGLGEEELLNGFYIADDGELFIGREAGYFSFYPQRMLPPAQSVPVVITSVKIMDREWMDSIDFNFHPSLQLPHDQNLLSIGFASLNFINPETVQYAYRLLGTDSTWIDAGKRRYISFGSLAPGKYTFQVKAISSHVQAPPTPYTLYIEIVPPFWQRTWFYLLLVVGVLIGLSGIHGYRLHRVRKEEALKASMMQQVAQMEMKALRAQMNPHFIFNSLNSINGFIAKNEQKAAAHYIARFARLIRQILENAQHEYISLQNEISTLSLYLEMEAVRFEDKFHYKIEVGEDILTQSLMIPSMVIQPYVENAIWHGLMQQPGKGFLLISFEQVNDQKIKVVIEDNGIGREKAKAFHSKNVLKNKSYGMKITSDRIKLLNQLKPLSAEQQVIDLYDNEGNAKGTKIILHLPLKQELKNAEV